MFSFVILIQMNGLQFKMLSIYLNHSLLDQYISQVPPAECPNSTRLFDSPLSGDLISSLEHLHLDIFIFPHFAGALCSSFYFSVLSSILQSSAGPMYFEIWKNVCSGELSLLLFDRLDLKVHGIIWQKIAVPKYPNTKKKHRKMSTLRLQWPWVLTLDTLVFLQRLIVPRVGLSKTRDWSQSKQPTFVTVLSDKVLTLNQLWKHMLLYISLYWFLNVFLFWITQDRLFLLGRTFLHYLFWSFKNVNPYSSSFQAVCTVYCTVARKSK